MRNRSHALILVTLATSLLGACSESHGGDDAEITFDAELPGPDAGPAPSAVGAPCRGDMDCDDGSCLTDFPGGYCTAVCTSADDCPGSSCVVVDRDGSSICLESCDPSASTCRVGYGCSSDGVCLPGCDDDADCDEGLLCEPDSGFSGEGSCFSEDGVGQPCTTSGDCDGDLRCASEDRWDFPGGACIAFGCDPATNSGCPGDSQCLPLGFGGGSCFDGCEDDDDCREGYACTPDEDYPDRTVCFPVFDPANLGQICSAGRGSCTAGECLSEGAYGWPDSYCIAVGCTPGAVPSDCPGDGVCWGVGDGVCLDGCSPDGDDCRAGYECVPADPTDPSSPTACRPGGCTDATVCGNDGFECNPGTGLCTEPFDAGDLGEPCIDDPSICVGGRCLSEDDEGWPAGTCTYPGCDLSGGDAGAPCPEGSACVDDGGGDPALGVCTSTCTVSASSCRSNYACVPLTDGSDAGTCTPACGEGACSAGRTCNTETGLCE